MEKLTFSMLVDPMRKLLPALLSLIIVAILASPVNAVPPAAFTDDDAKDLLGHTFKEEYWTTDEILIEKDGAEMSFSNPTPRTSPSTPS